MRDTRFDARSSEWIGDMTVWLRDHAEDNSEQLERLPAPACAGPGSRS